MTNTAGLWGQKNATLSDKTAALEYGISREELLKALNEGALQCREGSIYGNPWYRLLRTEVERYVEKTYGSKYLKERKAQKELSEINRELKELKKRTAELEARKKELCDGD